jgi:hypothetical protein
MITGIGDTGEGVNVTPDRVSMTDRGAKSSGRAGPLGGP